ncbi:MAG: hypothetical protein ABJF01_16290 [bacterium]
MEEMSGMTGMSGMSDMKGAEKHHHHEADEPPHNMMVVGEKTIFLSHLPMFMTPHNFQLILEATFSAGGKDLQAIYAKDRQSHPNVTMYTLSPIDQFKLATLFTPHDKPARTSFKATIFRGHLERGGKPIKDLTDITVTVQRVVYAAKLDSGSKSKTLEYRLFGKHDEQFLAHVIGAAPDFDQLLAVKIPNAPMDEEIARGVSVELVSRSNTASARIKEKEKVVGKGHVSGAHQFLQLEIQSTIECYFEEGELSSADGSFKQTPEEKKAGF